MQIVGPSLYHLKMLRLYVLLKYKPFLCSSDQRKHEKSVRQEEMNPAVPNSGGIRYSTSVDRAE